MKSRAAAIRHRQRQIVLTACLAVASIAGQAVGGEIVGAPIDISALVHEGLIPGGTIFEDTREVTGAFTTPKESAEYLYLATKGENLSGRSTNIQDAFASALAESDGNGGVGVTSFIGRSPSNTDLTAIQQLFSKAIWNQSFTYNGTIPVQISLSLHIPALQVGLIGVPPNRDSVSATETAQAKATLTTAIIHPDSSISPGGSFEFGLRAFEQQLLIRPGDFSNFADVRFIGVNNSTVSLFDSFKDNGDRFNPRFSLDSVTANVTLGTLQPGDTLSYIYQLSAEGTTHRAEQGFVAFLGDPFGQDVITDNLILTASPVPEPATSMLSVIGLSCTAVMLSGRRATPIHSAGRAGALDPLRRSVVVADGSDDY
jgi:hypothetical protein